MRKTVFLGIIFLLIVLIFTGCDFFYFDNPFAVASNDGVGTSQPGDKKDIDFSLSYFLDIYKPSHQTMVYCPGDSPIAGTNKGFWISQNEVTEELFQIVQCNSSALGYTFINYSGSNLTDMGAVMTNLNGTGNTTYPRTHSPLSDIVIWCNLLSESTGRDPVYLNSNEQVIRNDSLFNLNDMVIDLDANGYRLPTIDEWQQAASFIDGYVWTSYDRAAGALKDITDTVELARVANYSVSALNVKTASPTILDLYDMSGNAQEAVSYTDESLINFGSNTLTYLGGQAGDGDHNNFTIGNIRTTTNYDTLNFGIRLCCSNL